MFKLSFAQLGDVAQVICLDFRGHGRSDRGGPARWTVDDYAEDVRAFCDVLGIGHPVALSSGGMVAMAYAARHPDHLANLVLQSTMARLDIVRVTEGFRRVGGDQAAEIARRFWSGAGLQALTGYAETCAPLYGPGRVDPDAVARTVFNLELLSGPGSVMGGVDLLPELAHVTCPVLVVAGDLDPVCGADAAAEIVAALPAGLVRFCQFPGAGHHIHRDQPDRFFPLLQEFVAGQAAPSMPVPAMPAASRMSASPAVSAVQDRARLPRAAASWDERP